MMTMIRTTKMTTEIMGAPPKQLVKTGVTAAALLVSPFPPWLRASMEQLGPVIRKTYPSHTLRHQKNQLIFAAGVMLGAATTVASLKSGMITPEEVGAL